MRFEGKTDTAGYELGSLTFSVDSKIPGTYDDTQFDINLVLTSLMGPLNEHGTDSYSLQAHEGSTVTITAVTEDRVQGEWDFDVSPTQHASKDLVYRLKGSFNFAD